MDASTHSFGTKWPVPWETIVINDHNHFSLSQNLLGEKRTTSKLYQTKPASKFAPRGPDKKGTLEPKSKA